MPTLTRAQMVDELNQFTGYLPSESWDHLSDRALRLLLASERFSSVTDRHCDDEDADCEAYRRSLELIHRDLGDDVSALTFDDAMALMDRQVDEENQQAA